MFAIRLIVSILILAAGQSSLLRAVAADTVSREERARLDTEMAELPAALRARFDQSYREWRKTWERPDILVSSNAKAVRSSEEFRSLVSLGPRILPLVVD